MTMRQQQNTQLLQLFDQMTDKQRLRLLAYARLNVPQRQGLRLVAVAGRGVSDDLVGAGHVEDGFPAFAVSAAV